MKKIVVNVAAVLLLSACNLVVTDGDVKNWGPVETCVYAIDRSYNELEVSNAFTVVMSDTVAEPTVSIAADLHDKLVFRIDEGTLVIGLKPGRYGNLDEALVMLPHNAQLDDIELSGASHFSSTLPIAAAEVSIGLCGASSFKGTVQASRELDIEASGASHITAEVQAPSGSADIELSGASSATLDGAVDVLDIDVSGASSLNALNLVASSVKGDVGGASKADVLCCQSISVAVGGTSHLTYGLVSAGCTPAVNCRTSGASTATQR